MWVCPSCGSANELGACWRCRAARPADASEVAAPAAAAPPPPAWGTAGGVPSSWPQYGAPGYYPMPARRPMWPWLVGVAAIVLITGVLAARIAVSRAGGVQVTTGSPSSATTPATIAGLTRTGDAGPAASAALGGLKLLNITSGTYGTGPVRYVLVTISGGILVGDHAAMAEVLAPQVAGDDTVDANSRTTVTRDGVTFTCERMTGVEPGAVCSWNANSVIGIVTQLGSTDITSTVDFAAASHASLHTT